MSIPVVENPSITYVGDGTNKDWEFPYDFSSYDVIKLRKINKDGTEEAVTNDYTYKPNTKIFIYPVNGNPLTSEEKILLYRETPIKQSAVLPELYPYSNIVDEFDYIIMILQEQNVLSREGIKLYEELKKEFKNLADDVATSIDGVTKAMDELKKYVLQELANTTADVDRKIREVLAKIETFSERITAVENSMTQNKIELAKQEVRIVTAEANITKLKKDVTTNVNSITGNTTSINALERGKEDKGVAKDLFDGVENGVVGAIEGEFPVIIGKKGKVYKHSDNYYVCKVNGEIGAMVPDNRFEMLTLESLYTDAHEYNIEQMFDDIGQAEEDIKTANTKIAKLVEDVALNKSSNENTYRNFVQFRSAAIGQNEGGQFPVRNGKENTVYWHAGTNRYYKCLVDGVSAEAPNESFEEISLLTLSNKSGGGGGGDYDELKRKVAALETGKENKGVAKDLVDPLEQRIESQRLMLGSVRLKAENNTYFQNGIYGPNPKYFPVKNSKLDEVYVKGNQVYKCLKAGINATVPDENFEKISLLALSNKGGGGGGDYDEIKRKVAALETGKEDKGVAKDLDVELEKLIISTDIGTFPIEKTVARKLYKYNGRLYRAWVGNKSAEIPNNTDFVEVDLHGIYNKLIAVDSEAGVNKYSIASILGGEAKNSFPVKNSVKGKIYKKGFEYYKCMTDGINADVPDDNFIRLSLLALSDKANGLVSVEGVIGCTFDAIDTFPVSDPLYGGIYIYENDLYIAFNDTEETEFEVPQDHVFHKITLDGLGTELQEVRTTGLERYEGICGEEDIGIFPVRESVKGKLYKKNHKVYKCLVDGIRAVTPDENFERVSLLTLSNKSGGGADTGELKKLIIDTEIGTFPIASTVAGRVYEYNGKLYIAMFNGKQANTPNGNFYETSLGKVNADIKRWSTIISDEGWYRAGIYGNTPNTFPVTNGSLNGVYLKGNEVYRCLKEGVNARKPDENFEKISLLDLSKKIAGAKTYTVLAENKALNPYPPNDIFDFPNWKGFDEYVVEMSGGGKVTLFTFPTAIIDSTVKYELQGHSLIFKADGTTQLQTVPAQTVARRIFGVK